MYDLINNKPDIPSNMSKKYLLNNQGKLITHGIITLYKYIISLYI